MYGRQNAVKKEDEPLRKLREENEQLRTELAQQRVLAEKATRFRSRIAGFATGFTIRILLSRALVDTLKAWLRARSYQNPAPVDETAELLAAIVRRVIRVGWIGLAIAALPMSLLVWQNILIQRQVGQQASDTLIVRRAQLLETIYDCQEEHQSLFAESRPEGAREGESEVSEKETDPKSKCRPKAHIRARQEAVLAFVEIEKGQGMQADLSWANLTRDPRPVESHLEHAAGAKGADFRDADFSHVNLFKAELRNAYFAGANLRKAILNDADLSGANFFDADLTEASLFQATLHKASFLSANVSGVVLSGADLREAYLGPAINLNEVELGGANLSGADLARADLREVYLVEARLNGADLREANLSGARLSRATLGGADLRGANLGSADLNEADLRGVDLSKALSLTQEQVNEARGDGETQLPPSLEVPADWLTVAEEALTPQSGE